MISERRDREAYVWIWLPGETEPVVAGKLEAEGDAIHFNYGKSYLERIRDTPPAIPIHEPELPLRPGKLPLLEGLNMPGCIRDRKSSGIASFARGKL
jgi:serine/threonine-protein kinase HipA